MRVAANNGTEVEWSGDGEGCTWILSAGLNGTGTEAAPITVTSKYVTSLYWAMMTATTVGYGDISITNTSEQMYAVVIMILSNLMGAIIFGNVATLIQSLNASENRHANRIEMVEELIETHGISEELADRMRETIEYQWDLTRCFDMDQALELLPQSLRVDVLMYVHKQLIMKVPFFQDCDDAFIKTVVYRLRSELVLTKDVIFHEGDAADEMYFLRRGNVNVLAPRSTRVVATLNEGGFFGEIGILVDNGRRTNTVVACSKCEYYTLQKTDLDWVLDRFPEYRELLRAAALKRLQEMAKVLDASLEGESVRALLIW
jgi:voltage-gated potassium channel